MENLYTRLGPNRIIDESVARVLCLGVAPGAPHVGGFLVNGTTWGFNVRSYEPRLHICNGGSGLRGCVIATHLRALEYVYRITTAHTRLRVQMTSDETERLIRQWQSGDLTPPAWFTPDGKNGKWLARLAKQIAREPDKISVVRTTLNKTAWKDVAQPAINSLLRNAGKKYSDERAARMERDLLALLESMPGR